MNDSHRRDKPRSDKNDVIPEARAHQHGGDLARLQPLVAFVSLVVNHRRRPPLHYPPCSPTTFLPCHRPPPTPASPTEPIPTNSANSACRKPTLRLRS